MIAELRGWLSDFRGWRVEQRSQDTTLGMRTADIEILSALLNRRAITANEAMNIPTVAGCVEFIAGQVAMLPVRLYRRNGDDVNEVKDDPRTQILNMDTGDLLSGYQWKKAMIRDYLLEGVSYSYIGRQRNALRGLHYLDRASVSVVVSSDPIHKKAEFIVDGQRYRDFEFLKITRNTKDGVTGRGILQESRDLLHLAYAYQVYERAMMESGGNKRGFLSSENRLTEEQMTELKIQFAEMYSASRSGVIVLNKGLGFKELSATAVELQLHENKESNGRELCKPFNLSPDVIAGKVSDDEFIQVMKTAILPVVEAFTAALNKDLLLENEKGSLFFAFDTRDSLKGDTLKRYQAWEVAAKNNIMQLDEIRAEENLPPLGLEFIKLGLQDVLYDPKTKAVFVPNTGVTSNVNNQSQRQASAQEPVAPAEPS